MRLPVVVSMWTFNALDIWQLLTDDLRRLTPVYTLYMS